MGFDMSPLLHKAKCVLCRWLGRLHFDPPDGLVARWEEPVHPSDTGPHDITDIELVPLAVEHGLRCA